MSGISFVLGDTPLMALLQTIIPDHLQGRVLALMSTLMALAAPVGLALTAPLGEWIGVRGVFVVAGVLGTLASLAGFLSPALLALDDPSGPDAKMKT